MGLLINNPVLEKEVRGRLRARKQTKAGRTATLVGVGAVVLLLYYFSLTSIFTSNVGNAAEGLFVFFSIGLELTLLLFLVPALAASAITQEREQQTWNALLLSRLTWGEIVYGKFIAALLPALIVLLVFAPLKLIAAIIGDIGFARYLLTNLLLLVTVLFLTAISLFWSWLAKRTFIATASAFGTVAFLVVGTFLIYGLYSVGISYSRYVRPEEFPLLWINPYMAVGFVLEKISPESVQRGLICTGVYLVLTLILLQIITRRLSRGPKELEQ